ncbi:PD-(D/E)XK nuclease family transposase [Novipirellula artificiosorum]|uniref:PD-(D/E)XK nuclease family transposase n=2 Tax=Novipirellula artificiosorum TaxID=2528016 RepID=A0A5C6CU90_9BACT|nr:PD-(D/E)XK nuclease family transposase [Novipirellula artificiosorum]
MVIRPLLSFCKYVIPGDNKPIIDPIEQWLYFFREAANQTAEQLARRLPGAVFTEAVGVLEMIAKNPEERQHYEDRLKAERDEWARTEQAKLDGKLDGKLEERLRVVKMLRDIVGETDPSDSDLAGLSLDQLGQLETTYQQRLRDRT